VGKIQNTYIRYNSEKLLLMRNMADKARICNLSTMEIQELNYKINSLAIQVKALDEESKRIDSR
jgi:polyhydroxyalkanoate synthesis regulator phasin